MSINNSDVVYYVKAETRQGIYGKLGGIFLSKYGAMEYACKMIMDHFTEFSLDLEKEFGGNNIPETVVKDCTVAFNNGNYELCIAIWNNNAIKCDKLFTYKPRMISIYP